MNRTPEGKEGVTLQVQLQEPKAGTCVSCAAVNALRHHGLEAPVDEVMQALSVQRFHGRDGSFLGKASKYLRREYNMDAVVSRPPHLIMDPTAATLEVAYRFEALLMQGYVGLIWRKETPKSSHAVVLHRVLWERGEPYFVCYDSNKRDAAGHWTYKVADYVFWRPDVEDDHAEPEEESPPRPTGRMGYFVRPGTLNPEQRMPGRSFFRSRRPTADTGANGPPGG